MAATEYPDVELTDELSDVVERLQESGDARTVFADPVEREGRTVVPVARVAYGVGGGFGRGPMEATEGEGGGSGGGFGGGVAARPLGAIEITDHDTRFVAFPSRRRQAALAATFLGGLLLGALLRRRG